MNLGPIKHYWAFGVLASVMLAGCDRQQHKLGEPATAWSTADDSKQAGPIVEPTWWQQETEPGQLMIGNVFPDLGKMQRVLGNFKLLQKSDSRMVVVIGADEIAESDSEMSHWSKQIQKFGDDFQFLFVNKSPETGEWKFFESLAQNHGLNVVYAENANEANIDEKFLWPSGTTASPRVFVIGPDSHIDWIGLVYGGDGHAIFKRVLKAIQSGIWDRASEHESFEEDVATYRNARRLNLAIAEAADNEDYDKAIEIIRNIHEDVAKLHPSERSQLRYIAIKGNRHDVLNEVIAVDALKHSDDAEWLAEAAYKLAIGQQGDDKNLAVQLAEQSCELTEFNDAKHLYSLAFTEAVNSNPTVAVQWTVKARELSQDDAFQQHAEKMIREALPQGTEIPEL